MNYLPFRAPAFTLKFKGCSGCSIFNFSFGHYAACPSSFNRFWLPLWYLQTLFH